MKVRHLRSVPNDRRDHERRAVERRDVVHAPPRLGLARRALLWGSLALLAVTGAAWLYVQYRYAPAHDDFEAHTVQGPLMQLHAAVALVVLLVAGSLADLHVRVAWRRVRNRASGALMLATGVVVTLSGYGLWYANGDALHDVAERAHWITGFGLPLLLGLHTVLGRRTRPAVEAERAP